MKICEHCKAYNSDSRQFCVDCSKKLGDPISPAEEKRIRDALDDKVDDLYESGEPYKIETVDYVLGIACTAAFVAEVAALIVSIVQGRYQPTYLWLVLIGLLFTFSAFLACFLPEWSHEINRVFLEIRYRSAYDLTPNTKYFLFIRRLGSAVVLIALIAFILFIFM